MQENWIVPCSVKYYDVVSHLKEKKTIVWRKVSALKEGDTVYLYLGAPYSEIKFKCHIINDNVDEETVAQNAYAIKKTDRPHKDRYLLLELDYVYPDGELSLEKLRAHGLGQTQTQARTDRKLQAFINSVNEKLNVQ